MEQEELGVVAVPLRRGDDEFAHLADPGAGPRPACRLDARARAQQPEAAIATVVTAARRSRQVDTDR